MSLPTPTRSKSITELGNGNFLLHMLLPNENEPYTMNVNKLGETDNEVEITFADMDPLGIGGTIRLKKVSATILGPKQPGMGGFLLVVEKDGVTGRWLPILVVDDGQYSGSFEWPAGYEIPVTDDLQLCASTKYMAYSSGASWTFGPGWVKRSVELDIYYHIGT
jgi:hypothetical protein